MAPLEEDSVSPGLRSFLEIVWRGVHQRQAEVTRQSRRCTKPPAREAARAHRSSLCCPWASHPSTAPGRLGQTPDEELMTLKRGVAVSGENMRCESEKC